MKWKEGPSDQVALWGETALNNYLEATNSWSNFLENPLEIGAQDLKMFYQFHPKNIYFNYKNLDIK